MYSDISILIIAFWLSNKNDARALLNSVLPTPVGPKNKNEPRGLFGSWIPAFDLLTALLTELIASFWPITFVEITFSMDNIFCLSPSSNLSIWIPVHLETTAAISFSPTSLFNVLYWPKAALSCSFNFFSNSGILPYIISLAFVKSPFFW